MGNIAKLVSTSINYGRDSNAYDVAHGMLQNAGRFDRFTYYLVADRAVAAEHKDVLQSASTAMAAQLRKHAEGSPNSRAIINSVLSGL